MNVKGYLFFYDIYIKLLFCERHWKSNSPKLIRLRFILAVRRYSKLRSSKGTNQNSPIHRGPVQPYDKNLYLTWPTCMILRGSCIERWCWPRMLRPVKDIWARLSPARTKSIIEVTGSDCRYSGYNGKNTSHLVCLSSISWLPLKWNWMEDSGVVFLFVLLWSVRSHESYAFSMTYYGNHQLDGQI